jgi:phosphoribosylformylglycinamidine synthase
VSVASDNIAQFERLLQGFPHTKLGQVTDGQVTIDGTDWGSIVEWKKLYDTAIERMLSRELESEGALGML